MKKTKALIILLALFVGLFFYQCEDEDEKDEKVELTQDMLDKATTEVNSFTGNTGAAAIPHGGPEGISIDSTIRVVYATGSSIGSSIDKGTVIAKRTYKKNTDGSKGTLFVTFAMFKRESGYDPDHADWEYFQMPADQEVDYNAHPNGSLSSGKAASGMLEGCISCHGSAGGGDYVFTND